MADELIDAFPVPTGTFVTYSTLVQGNVFRIGTRSFLMAEAGSIISYMSLDYPWWVVKPEDAVSAGTLVEKLPSKVGLP